MPRTGNSLALTDDLSEGHEGTWLKPKKKTQEKGKLNRKWNFFHRTLRSPERPAYASTDSLKDSQGVNVAVSRHPESKTVAHYAMMDGSEQGEEEDLETRLREIENSLEQEGDDATDPFVSPLQPRQPSMLLPSPPILSTEFSASPRSASSKVMLNFDALPRMPPARNNSRLPQVGRIPKVAPRQSRAHNPSPQSFSRPFAPRTSMDETISTTSSTVVERPILAVETEPLKQASWTPISGKPASAATTNAMLYNLDGENEFMAFSPRQNSSVSGSGSSGVLSLAHINALAPVPSSVLSEDEVWNEYDELLDRVASPATFDSWSPEAGQSVQSLQQYESAQASASTDTPKASPPKQEGPSTQPLGFSHARPRQVPVPRSATAAQIDNLRPPPQFNQLSSPVSISDVYANYGNRKSQEKSPVRQSVSSTISGSIYSSQTMVSRSGSRSSTNSIPPERVTKFMAEKISNTPDETLRFSALMTSRWLSFDRVLFSPVQAEIRANRQDRVLVVDGLENDDWSCYCALSYPDATFYNLSAAPVASWIGGGGSGGSGGGAAGNHAQWSPPSNHRRISHASVSAPFPFPKGFFTAVVLRFPAAHPLAAYRSLVAECKRVLRPGGYLELTVLDMDLVNMDPRARRAVRELKMRVQAASPEVSLSPVSDTLTRLLGRKGFENLHSCVVGVPVAGTLADSSRSNSLDDGPQQPSASASASAPDGRPDPRSSLRLLLSGQTSALEPQYPMARMVARVGRWWWSRCYESRMLALGHDSIWDARGLLAECEAAETGLRLMVAYAQKPVNARRRTVSV